MCQMTKHLLLWCTKVVSNSDVSPLTFLCENIISEKKKKMEEPSTSTGHSKYLLTVKEKVDIEFDSLHYAVKVPRQKGKKQVIRGVSGKFKSGELTAIMGPSGAGKTSLLNILTGFQMTGTEGIIKSQTGAITRIGAQQYKKESCYILQDDQLAPLFTVYETMKMAAELKLGHTISEKGKEFLIQDILDTLGLSACRETRCQRLSGGQKKRLSIALELIDNPPIMFLDEPTTGLDSSSSLMCITMLKQLARGGRTIICTIHQPSATLYEMFDHVYVMAEGKCIYQGASTNTVQYLASVGFECPQYHNPADYLLEVANGEYGNYTEYLAKAADDEKWRIDVKKTPPVEIQMEIEEKNGTLKTVSNTDLSVLNKSSVLKSSPSEWFKFSILVERVFVQIYRDWTISHLKLALHMVVGTLLGLLYYKIGQDASKTINNVGFLLVGAVYLCYTSLMPAVLKFPSELAVLKKERFNNWYRLKTYYAAFLVADVPMQMLFSLVYVLTTYFLSAQPLEEMRFLRVLFIYILVTLTASSMGLVLGTTVTPVNGTFLGAIITCVMIVVSGFIILFTHMSRPMYMLSYCSYLSFALEALVQAIYGYNREPIPCPDHIEYCHYRMPPAFLKEIGMDKPNYWIDVTYLAVWVVVLRVVAFYTLKKSLSSK